MNNEGNQGSSNNQNNQTKENTQKQQGNINNAFNVKMNNIMGAVNKAMSLAENSLKSVNPTESDLDWNIVSNFANPTREEINTQLNRIPSIQAYFNNMKVDAKLILDIAEHNLFISQVKAREEFQNVHRESIKRSIEDVSLKVQDALRSTAQDKAMALALAYMKQNKPKEPTEKDVEAYVKSRTSAAERRVIEYKNNYEKLKEYCRILENKFLAARALRYSIEEDNKANTNFSKNSV